MREKNEKKLIAALYKEESGLISLPVSGLHMTPVVYLKETFFLGVIDFSVVQGRARTGSG